MKVQTLLPCFVSCEPGLELFCAFFRSWCLAMKKPMTSLRWHWRGICRRGFGLEYAACVTLKRTDTTYSLSIFFFLQFRLILIPTGSQSIALQYKYSDAEELYRHVYGIDVKLYGEDHPLVAIDLTNRAKMLRAQVGLNSIFFIMFLGMKGTPQIIVAKKNMNIDAS